MKNIKKKEKILLMKIKRKNYKYLKIMKLLKIYNIESIKVKKLFSLYIHCKKTKRFFIFHLIN